MLKYTLTLILFTTIFFAQDKKNVELERLFDAIDSCSFHGDYENFKTLTWKAKTIAKHSKDTFNILKSNEKLLIYFIYENLNKDSVEYYHKESKELLKTFKSNEWYAIKMFLYAEYHISIGLYAKAYSLFNGIEPLIKEKKYNFIPYYYDSFSRLHLKLGEHKLALEKLNKGGAIFRAQKNLIRVSANYNNMGLHYQALKQPDSALAYYQKSIDISRPINDSIGLIYAFKNIGDVYLSKNKYTKAAYYLEEAYKIDPENPIDNLLSSYAIALTALSKYKKAEKLLVNAIEDTKGPLNKIEVLQSIVNLKKGQNKHQEALVLQDSLIVRKERLINSNKLEEIERLKAVYNTEKKEKEIQLLVQQKENQKLINKQNQDLGIIICIAVVLVFIILGLVFRNRIINERTNRIQLQQQLFRLQMSPHFIFNAISNIQTTILKNDNQKAVSYLTKFSKLVRNILEHSKDDKITLSQEIETIKSYLDLQQIRSNNAFKYSITIDDTIEDELIYVPPMLCQPLIENAIEHGIESIINGEINIHFKLFKKHINCVIIDNGIGFSNSKVSNTELKTSMSTQIIKNRLAIFSKRIKQALVFNIEDILKADKITGTKTNIDLPILN